MKKISPIIVALVIVLIIFAIIGSIVFVYPIIAGQRTRTLTKDFGVSNVQSSNGSTEFSYDVTVNIQTEPNGDWICGKTYHVSWVITLTYVNQTMFNDFTITFYQSFPTEIPNYADFTSPSGMVSAILRPLPYQTVGTPSTTFTIGNKSENFQFDFELDYSVTNNGLPAYYPVSGESVLDNGEWLQNTPLYINIVSQKNPLQVISNPSFIQPIYFSAVVIVIVIGAYAYIKKGKKPIISKNQ